MRASSGFTIIELLVVVAMMAIIFSIGYPLLFNTRLAAQDANAEVYASHVYKAAFAHLSGVNNTLVTNTDCKSNYTAGKYSASNNGKITSCEVTDAGDGTPLVKVVSLTGASYTFP